MIVGHGVGTFAAGPVARPAGSPADVAPLGGTPPQPTRSAATRARAIGPVTSRSSCRRPGREDEQEPGRDAKIDATAIPDNVLLAEGLEVHEAVRPRALAPDRAAVRVQRVVDAHAC